MIKRFKKIDWLLLLLLFLCIVVFCLTRNQNWVNHQYSTVFYPYLSSLLRVWFGGIGFSIGDFVYLILILLFLSFGLLPIVRNKRKKLKDIDINKHLPFWKKGLITFFILYLMFFVCWGFNYSRSGIAADLNMKLKAYDKAELIEINAYLLKRLNENALMLDSLNITFPGNDSGLFNQAIRAYEKAGSKFPFLQYGHPSLKPTVFSTTMSYLGINGYYNPFTGEAQVNTKVPVFTRPFTACHEIAHQLGYAEESLASFVAFIAAEHSGDIALQYSTYFELFLTANRSLHLYDSVSAKHWRDQLDKRVKADIKILKNYFNTYKNPIEPIVTKAYDLFLKSNRQKQGILSYNEVLLYLINYRKKENAG